MKLLLAFLLLVVSWSCGCESVLLLGDEARSSASGGFGGSGGEALGGGGAKDDSPCSKDRPEAERKRPVDFVFLVDNSSSMAENIETFQNSLGEAFFPLLASARLSARIALVSRYGTIGEPVADSENPVCIGPPLTNLDCAAAPPELPAGNARFLHYSANIESDTALCVFLEAFESSDELPAGDRPWTPLAPRGLRAWFDPLAFKVIIVMTDAEAGCSFRGVEFGENDFRDSADRFEGSLRALSTEQFGTETKKNFVFHSVVGLLESDSGDAFAPTEPVIAATCGSGASSAGLVYQALSIQSGGLRFPSCAATKLAGFYERVIEELDTELVCP